jgi:CheY-like chemotaxis protein
LTSLPTTVTFASECPDPGPVISADANQIQEILSCLIANAQEALGDAKGSIRFAIGIHPAAEIPAVHRFPVDWQPRAQAYASMEVADDGSGIPSADMEKLFDPFFSTKFTGRGLGLSVVLGLVQAHGGAVTVRSELGRGSLFRVYFPVLEEASPAPARGEVSASPGEWGGVVLLVDDDEIVLSSTGALLERMGFTVLTAMDGVEAMAAFHQRSNDIRCVITDLSMPRMDGWETLAALRQLKPDLPVILASGYGKAQILSTGHVEHPQAFLGKPFSFRQLRDTLGQVLGISGEPQG